MELKHEAAKFVVVGACFPYRISSWVSAEDSKTEIFDVFLCHNSEDKPAVRKIAQHLVREGIKPWLDMYADNLRANIQRGLGARVIAVDIDEVKLWRG